MNDEKKENGINGNVNEKLSRQLDISAVRVGGYLGGALGAAITILSFLS